MSYRKEEDRARKERWSHSNGENGAKKEEV